MFGLVFYQNLLIVCESLLRHTLHGFSESCCGASLRACALVWFMLLCAGARCSTSQHLLRVWLVQLALRPLSQMIDDTNHELSARTEPTSQPAACLLLFTPHPKQSEQERDGPAALTKQLEACLWKKQPQPIRRKNWTRTDYFAWSLEWKWCCGRTCVKRGTCPWRRRQEPRPAESRNRLSFSATWEEKKQQKTAKQLFSWLSGLRSRLGPICRIASSRFVSTFSFLYPPTTVIREASFPAPSSSSWNSIQTLLTVLIAHVVKWLF